MRKIKNFKTKAAVLCGIVITAVFINLSGGCPIRRFMGVVCPGCGMTRALTAVLHLDFKQALIYHPMVWSLPLLLLYFLYDGRLFKNKKINSAVLCLILSGFLAFWIYRLVI